MENARAGPVHVCVARSASAAALTTTWQSSGAGEFAPTSRLLCSLVVNEYPLCVCVPEQCVCMCCCVCAGCVLYVHVLYTLARIKYLHKNESKRWNTIFFSFCRMPDLCVDHFFLPSPWIYTREKARVTCIENEDWH